MPLNDADKKWIENTIRKVVESEIEAHEKRRLDGEKGKYGEKVRQFDYNVRTDPNVAAKEKWTARNADRATLNKEGG